MNEIIKETVIAPEQGMMESHTGEVYSKKTTDTPSKPSIDFSGYSWLQGNFGASTDGAHLVPIAIQEYLGGTVMDVWNEKALMMMEALKHVNFDVLKAKFYAVYCPNSRVWDGYEKFASQRGGPYADKPSEVPTASVVLAPPVTGFVHPSNITTVGRDSIYNAYCGPVRNTTMTVNMLPLRQYCAIANDIFRPKAQLPPYPEWRDDVPTQREIDFFMRYGVPTGQIPNQIAFDANYDSQLSRVAALRTYYTDYRPEVYTNNDPVDNNSLFSHIVTQQAVSEWRSQAQNFEMTDEEVIAEIRRTRVARENIPFVIGENSVDISLSLQPQTSEGVVPLGTPGAFSFTEVDLSIDLKRFRAPKDGYIHYFWVVQSESPTVSEKAFPRELFYKRGFSDFYRPELAHIKDDVLYGGEIDAELVGAEVGFKRRYSEYFRLPNFIRGDFLQLQQTTWGRDNNGGYIYYDFSGSTPQTLFLDSMSDWHLHRTGFMPPFALGHNQIDFSDIMVGRFMLDAYDGIDVLSESQMITKSRQRNKFFHIFGRHQIHCDQPIDRKIKNDFIRIGEE